LEFLTAWLGDREATLHGRNASQPLDGAEGQKNHAKRRWIAMEGCPLRRTCGGVGGLQAACRR
jgi:hypothetical protein